MEASQDSIHEAGKGGRCVAQTKGDLVEFEQLPTARPKCSLSFVLFGDRHLPVSTLRSRVENYLAPWRASKRLSILGKG